MATTKRRISEQVLRRLKAGRPDAASGVRIEELMLAVGQVVNSLIKATMFNQTLPNGESCPATAVVATYSDLPVVKYKNVSKATLPCMPVNLLRGQGVQQIGSNTDEFCQFIPMTADDFVLLKKMPLINDLAGYIGYKLEGLDVIFYENLLTKSPATTSVEAKLVVLDVDSMDDWAILPIPADFEPEVIETIFKMFAMELPNDPNTDLLTEQTAK